MRPRETKASVYLALALLLLAAPACAEKSPPAPPAAGEWQLATPASRGLDPAPLEALVAALRRGARAPNVHGLLIVKDGALVLEEYFDGWSAERPHTLQSVSKSVTSAIVGIAIDRGLMRLDEKVLAFFPKMKGIEHVDDRKRTMRVEDLLTMRGGTDYHEGYSGSPHNTLNSMSRGWDLFVLSRPMEADPGTRFRYDSGGVILLSSLIEARTGHHADVLATEALFAPLGIDPGDVEWFKNADGHPHMGGGLDMRPRDMAKFGLLYLRGGRWGDRQVISQSWVEASTKIQVPFDPPKGRDIGYGYLWWIMPPARDLGDEQNIVAAAGFMGQYIFLVPEHDMVVVVTAGARGRGQNKPIDVLYDDVLPAVRR